MNLLSQKFWHKKKYFLVGLAVFLVIGLGLSINYYSFLKDKTKNQAQAQSGFSPVADYRFRETSYTAVDISGQNNNGIIYGANYTSDGAWNFDGIDDYAQIPDSQSLNITESVTLMAQVKPTTDTVQSHGNCVVGKNFRDPYSMHLDQGKIMLGITFQDDTYNYLVGDNSRIYPNQWQHITIVRDFANQNIRFYVNGRLKDTFTGYDKLMKVMPDDLFIGTNKSGSGVLSNLFEGQIDNVAVFNSALPDSEIAERAKIFNFAVFGDPHIVVPPAADQPNWAKAESIAKNLLENAVTDINTNPEIDLVIIDGDITDNGTYNQFVLAKNILDNLHIPYYPIVGNHDNMQSDNFAAFLSVFGFSSINYSFDFKGFHFTVADATLNPYVAPYVGWNDSALNWVRSDLSSYSTQPTFFLSHYNLWNYSGTTEPWDNNAPSRSNEIRTILEEAGNVIATIGGHTHRNRYQFNKLGYVNTGCTLVYPAALNYFQVYPNQTVMDLVPLSDQALVDYVNALASDDIKYKIDNGANAVKITDVIIIPHPMGNVIFTKIASVSQAFRGETITYTISYANNNFLSNNVQIEDSLPTGTSLVLISGGGVFDGEKIVWNLGTLAPGSTGSVGFRVQIQ